MNAAVNKLKKDIWKDEAVDKRSEAEQKSWTPEEERHAFRQRLRERKYLQEQRTKRLEEEKAKAAAKEQNSEVRS